MVHASLASISAIENNSRGYSAVEDWAEEATSEDELLRRATWQKVVTRRAQLVSLDPLQGAESAAPIPDTPALRILPEDGQATNGRATTWVHPYSTPVRRAAFMPPPNYKKRRATNGRATFMTRTTGWIAMLVILALLVGGAFGVVVSLGRDTQPPSTSGTMSLQVTPPHNIAQGGVITLYGSHFSTHGRVGLTRDSGFVPIVDTGNSSFVMTDASGAFSDTVSIDNSWRAGTHTIRAEDVHLHKSATYIIQVTGNNSSLRPAHLSLSASSVNLGSGDQATNSTQAITLSNAGGGEISWQSTVTQPWLLLSPKSGTFDSSQQMPIRLGGDRSNLQIGSYSAEVIFSDATGAGQQLTLLVKMQVTQLQLGHEAVMQVTPSVLAFSGVDGSANPASQVVTVSNPGVLPLQWNAVNSTSDGSSWLNVSPQSGTVTKGNSEPVTIAVNSSLLLPGVYYGSVTFSSQGSQSVVNSPETIYISVTIVPQCGIQVSPGSLAFAAVYLQPAPIAKAISVGVNQGCSASLNWTVSATTSNGGKWLIVSAASGATPASPRVGISVTGLTPGNYSGALVFSTAAGTQTLPVTLVMGQPTTPILTSAPALFAANAVSGQTLPITQTITLTNSGGGTLTWGAVAVTTVGGAWLAVTPASGMLTAHQSALVTVTFKTLKTLIPGTYPGSITITGKDSTGHAAAGSPQTLPVTFIVQAPCTIATPLPALTFQSVIGQPAPAAQQITLSASGACANTLNWSATAATVPAGGTWLTLTPPAGVVSLTAPSLTMAGIVSTGLAAGTYTGSVTISATDSVTHLPVGTPQLVKVTLLVQPACTLQAPSLKTQAFTSETGLNPAAQTFTIGIIGGCSGSVTITPTATMTNGSGWLAVTPPSTIIASGSTATFTVTVTSSALAAGTYTGTISLAAVNSAGIAIIGSPQTVSITLNVLSPPALTASLPSLQFNITTGVNSQTVSINNTGSEPLNWSAALQSGAPSFVSISSVSSGSLPGGANTTITISVNATGLAGGTTYSTSVTISATDPLTGKAVSGSPSTVPITINIVPPAMHLSATALTFTTTAGTNPTPQTITITNSGGDALNWTAGAPSQTWLTVSPTTGSDTAGTSSTPTFTVNVGSLTASTTPYTATVNFTAPGGISQTVTVTLTIN